MGLFKKMKRTLGHNDSSLKDTGTKGTAKVLSDKDSHISVGGDDDDGPTIHKSRLLVTLPNQPPYEADYHRASGLKVDKQYDVYVDQNDPNNLFVDTGSGLEGVAQQISAMTGQSVGSSPDDIMAASRNMAAQLAAGAPGAAGAPPGGTADWHQMMQQSAKMALQYIQDPAQRKMLIEQYRAAGIQIDDDGAPPAK